MISWVAGDMSYKRRWYMEQMEKIRLKLGGTKNKSSEKPYSDFMGGFKKVECIRFVAENDEERTTEESKCCCGRTQAQHADRCEISQSRRLSSSRTNNPMAPSVPPLSVSQLSVPSVSASTNWSLGGPSGSPLQQSKLFKEAPWSPKEDLREIDTDSFGMMYFESEITETILPVQYLRLSSQSQIPLLSADGDPEVLKLLKSYWDLLEPSKPNLVISITGDTEATKVDADKTERLISSLIDAVKLTNAWLVTDGLDSGYTQLVGKAVGKAQYLYYIEERAVPQIKCVGVVPYGRLRGIRSRNESFKNKGKILRILPLNANETEQIPRLNDNHTHLLLVDNGFYGEKSNAYEFRSSLLRNIEEKPKGGLGIPVVVMLLGGRFSAIQECQSALMRNTPVMAVKGTGGAADLIALFCGESSVKTSNQIKDIIKEYLPKLDDHKLPVCAKAIAECSAKRELVTVYDLNSDDSVDKSLLFTLLAGNSDPLGKFKLALQWDRVDVAREKIFPQFESSGGKSDQLDNIMKNALLNQKEEFVELLLEKAVNMSQYLTLDVLRELYRETESDSHLFWLLKEEGLEVNIYLSHVHCLFKKLVGKHRHPLYENDRTNEEKDNITNAQKDNARFEDPYLELLLWAVVSRRDHLATYLWKKCKNPLCTALIATCLYHSLKEEKLFNKYNRLGNEYSKMKDIFELKAVQLLDQCYQDNPTKSLRILDRLNPRWGNHHMMDLALLANDMKFVASVCCQESVRQRWGNVKLNFYIRLASRFIVMLVHFLLVLFHLVLIPSSFEIFLVVYFISDTIEKIFEVVDAKSIKLWFSVWNVFDFVTNVLFLAGFCFRLCPGTFFIGKILYAFCAMNFCCRLFRFGYVRNTLGMMILTFLFMFPKLLDFMVILMVLLVGFGITSKALMHHPCQLTESLQNFSGYVQFFESITFNPYWQIFGELPLDSLESKDNEYFICQNMTWSWDWYSSCEICEPGPEASNCYCQGSNQSERIAYKLILALYLILGNVLLLNLVIAIFNNVYEQVKKKSSEYGKFEMYRLTREYEKKPALPSLFGVFVYFWRWYRRCNMPNKILDDSMPKRIHDASISPSLTEASLRIFEQNKARMELSNPSATFSDEFTELFKRWSQLEHDMTFVKGEIIKAGSKHQTEGTEDEEQPKENESLLSLSDKINHLEERLLSSQHQIKEEIRDMVEKLVISPSSPSSFSSP